MKTDRIILHWGAKIRGGEWMLINRIDKWLGDAPFVLTFPSYSGYMCFALPSFTGKTSLEPWQQLKITLPLKPQGGQSSSTTCSPWRGIPVGMLDPERCRETWLHLPAPPWLNRLFCLLPKGPEWFSNCSMKKARTFLKELFHGSFVRKALASSYGISSSKWRRRKRKSFHKGQ